MANISNFGLTTQLTNSLLSQQQNMALLTQQLSSNQQHANLTDYSPTDAHNIVDFQSLITQRQSYISSMQNVSARLSVYDSSLTDIEAMAAQAGALSSQNQAYSATSAADIQQSAVNYLKQLTDDLNQQIGGRYIYAGARFNTPPVQDLSTLTGTIPTTPTINPTLPTYDTQYSAATSFTVNTGQTPTGTFTIGNTTINWSQLANHSGNINFLVNGSAHSLAVAGISSGTTAADFASNLSLTLNAIAGSAYADPGGVPSTFSSSLSGSTVAVDFGSSTANAITPDAGGVAAETTWVGGSSPSGLSAQTPHSLTSAYTLDQATVDSNYKISYGISSNDPSFQKLVSGLRLIDAAVTAGQGGDSATYQTNMQQASTLIASALSGIQTIHAQVASNQNTIQQQTKSQNTSITDLQNQLTNIQQIDLTKVGTELSLMQTQLQASYSSTASLEKLSLLTYL